MKENLKTLLDYGFRLSHTNEGWILPIVDAVDSVDAEVAAWEPGEGIASIWEVTVHASGWLQDTLRTLTGSPGPENVDWPSVADRSPAAWRATQAQLRSAALSLRDEIKRSTEGDMAAAPVPSDQSKSRLIMNMIIHDSYHAGQIVKLRQMYRAANGSVRAESTATA